MNDEERKGGQREMRREVKTKRKGEERRWKQNQCVYVRVCVCVWRDSFSFYLLTVWERLRQ